MKIIGNKNSQYNQDTKKFNSITEATIKCSCGHSMILGSADKKICTHCGKWVFKDKQEEFKYRMGILL